MVLKERKGIFIAFEGIDGSGKSSQVALLAKRLRRMDYKVYETFEPTDSPIGSLIHQIMIGRIQAGQETIASLFVADRVDHLLNDINGILKKINDGFVVLTDRYYFSSYAYHRTHVDMNWIVNANSISSKILRPDLNIFIDVDPKNCIKRLNNERSHLELFENHGVIRQVRELYFKAFDKLKEEEKIEIINGEGTIDEIEQSVWDCVKYLFKVE